MIQQNFYTILFNKLNSSHKVYAKRILLELYPDKSINIQGICSKFPNKYQKIVNASVKDLENCNLICRVDNENKYSEKMYKLTKYGIGLVEDDSNINT